MTVFMKISRERDGIIAYLYHRVRMLSRSLLDLVTFICRTVLIRNLTLQLLFLVQKALLLQASCRLALINSRLQRACLDLSVSTGSELAFPPGLG